MKNSVFQLWQTIEALTPPEAARINVADAKTPVYGVALDGVMPWDDVVHQRKRIDAGWRWLHMAQCGVYSTDEVSRILVASMNRVTPRRTPLPCLWRRGPAGNCCAARVMLSSFLPVACKTSRACRCLATRFQA